MIWEAGTAYTDLATTFFGCVSLLALANGMRRHDNRWLFISAVLLGLTLSTKATSLSILRFWGCGSSLLVRQRAAVADPRFGRIRCRVGARRAGDRIALVYRIR